MRILVLGGYGQIGAVLVRRLSESGCEVVGLGRSAALGRRLAPQARWIGADIASLQTPAHWAPMLANIDAVVNASGALQDGAKDDLARVQAGAIGALVAACEQASVKRFVQISAPGASEASPIAFLRTKGVADARLRASALEWVIFKPGLVIGPNAYGGTALIRMLAAFPSVQPLVLGEAPIQTVSIDDVAEAVWRATVGAMAPRRDFDLVEQTPRTLRELIARFRAWAGFAPARFELELSRALGFAIARAADLAGWLGWRSPLRTTSLRVLSIGVTGDPGPWRGITGAPLASLDETLAAMPANMQERVFARAHLAFPLLVLTLAGFWIASGLIGALRSEAAAAMLPLEHNARAVVLAGAGVDLAIGAAVLVRPWTRLAAGAALLVSLCYLIAASVLTPALWADPLGPLVKIFPAMALALGVAALAEPR